MPTEQMLREVSTLTQSKLRLTEALVATLDQMAALRALISVRIDSLDAASALTVMLTEALELTGSDAAVLVLGGEQLMVGEQRLGERLRQDMVGRRVSAADGTHQLEFAGGAAVAAPVRRGGSSAVLGLARQSGPQYSTGDIQLIDAVVATTENLIALTKVHQQGVQQARLERELQLASTLAQAILPEAPPQVAGVEIFARVTPAQLAGGDFIAFEVLDGVLWFVAGDVAGKGLPAAIVMTRAVSAARVAFHRFPADDPAGAVAAVATELFDYLSGVGLFATMVLGAYRPGSGVLHLCNAGHSPVLTVLAGRSAAVPPSMPPVGVLRDCTGRTCAVPFGAGDVLVLGSDGLSEQESPKGELYGYDRFERKAAESAGLDLTAMGELLIGDVLEHAQGTPPSDDRTLVLLRASR